MNPSGSILVDKVNDSMTMLHANVPR